MNGYLKPVLSEKKKCDKAYSTTHPRKSKVHAHKTTLCILQEAMQIKGCTSNTWEKLFMERKKTPGSDEGRWEKMPWILVRFTLWLFFPPKLMGGSYFSALLQSIVGQVMELVLYKELWVEIICANCRPEHLICGGRSSSALVHYCKWSWRQQLRGNFHPPGFLSEYEEPSPSLSPTNLHWTGNLGKK